MANKLKESELILAEKLANDMDRFAKENKSDIPKEFAELTKSYKKDGKVTFKTQDDLQNFNNKLSGINFNSDPSGTMLTAVGTIDTLVKKNKKQLQDQLMNLVNNIEAENPKFYNKDNPRPEMPPAQNASEKEIKAWQSNMQKTTAAKAVLKTSFKHISSALLKNVKKIMSRSEAKSEGLKKEQAQNKGTQTPQRNRKNLKQLQKKGPGKNLFPAGKPPTIGS
ncbi:MAG: hypothetical protein H6909_03080 [Rickettsiaceae bacterium]|nr:hypothetical protein [Rickettsiaceae bacterium]